MSQQVLEGTWEEIVRQAGDLTGKKVRLIVIDEPHSISTRPLSKALEGILGGVDSTDGLHVGYPDDPFSETIAEKFRKQGLRIP